MIQKQSDLFCTSPVPSGTNDVCTPPLSVLFRALLAPHFLIKAPALQGREVLLPAAQETRTLAVRNAQPEPGGR